MFRKLAMAPGLALSLLVLQTAVAAEPLPPASQWIPQDAVIVLELSRPRALLDLATHAKVVAAVTSLPAYQQRASQPDFKQFFAVVDYLEARLGTDWKTGVGKLVGGGVTFAAAPDGSVLLFVDAEDGRMLKQLHEIFLGFARDEAAKQGRPNRVDSREYKGVTGWTFNSGEEVHAIVGNRLLVANRSAALKAVLDLRAEPDGPSLASLPTYQAAKRAAGPDATAVAYVNMEILKQHPPVQRALEESRNPLASLLLAGVIEAVRGSSWLAAELHAEGDTLALRAMMDGKTSDPSGSAAFALPSQPGEGALPNLTVPRRIAGLSLYRDLHSFYATKDELFPERTSGLIFFENMMGIFFSGRDLTEEVFAEARPEVRFVVAEQEYDPAVGTPGIQIPAFAAVFRLRHPEKFTEIAEEAWQKAVGLINFTRGQQALPGVIIDRPSHEDTQFTMAYFSSKEVEDRTNLDPRFNFRPSLATLGDYLIVSSAEELTRDLIDTLKNEIANPVKALPEAHSLMEIDVVQLASILGANRGNLVRQNMLEEGNTQDEAEAQIDILLTVLKYLGQAKLDLSTHDGQTQASLELKLNLP